MKTTTTTTSSGFFAVIFVSTLAALLLAGELILSYVVYSTIYKYTFKTLVALGVPEGFSVVGGLLAIATALVTYMNMRNSKQ